MDSALNVNDEKTTLVDAKTLKEMTPSQEELRETLKNNILDQVMSSMVKTAQHGGTSYAADFQSNFNQTTLDEIKTQFTTLGYEVTTSDSSVAGQQLVKLTLSWK